MNAQPGLSRVPYIIAEVGSNHNGNMELAVRMVKEAKKAGASAVKFQSWSPGSLVCRDEYDHNPSWLDRSNMHRHFGTLKEMCERYWLRPEQHRMLAAVCREEGIDFLSSVFSESEVRLCDDVGVPMHKVASMDVNYLRLLAHVGRSRKPVMLSTGMAVENEISRAVDTLMAEGAPQVYLLHCVSLYPTPPERRNVAAMVGMRERFKLPVGLSDHSSGVVAAVMAVALGAVIIEKHFTLDRDMPGWDHWFSADPTEMKELVEKSREAYLSIGRSSKMGISVEEEVKSRSFRRSIVTTRDMKAGEIIAYSDVTAKRPGTGIPPDRMALVVGLKLKQDVDADRMLAWSDLLLDERPLA